MIELLMRFCDAIPQSQKHKQSFFKPKNMEMTAFATHLCQWSARWCHSDSPEEQLGFLMSVPV